VTEGLLWASVFAVSLAVLLKAADVFIVAAEKLGLYFGLPRFIIGVTIVAIGTSLPELVAAVASVWIGASEVAIGTAVGSNVTNLLLILGIAAVVGGGLKVAYELVSVDLPYLFGSALLLTLFAYDGRVDALEGLLSLIGLAAYLVYTAQTAEQPITTVGAIASGSVPEVSAPSVATWLRLVVSALLLQASAHFTVDSTVRLSKLLGVGSELLAASAVALGTSLPELFVSLRAARAGQPEIAVGNVIGSNLFNALGVVGVAALFGAVVAPSVIVSYALPCMVGVTVLGFFVLQEREMTPWDGWLLLVLYAGFNLELFRVG
jgi:cation:H+ antiporter